MSEVASSGAKHMNIKINGKRVRSYTHEGNFYVEGREGTEYTIELRNDTIMRRLYVVSVDGINAISGKPAAEDPHNGYVINGLSSLDLKGFRINDNDVAAFKFVKSNKSYAKGITGSTINNGVIGVKVYEEKINLGSYGTTKISGNGWNNSDYVPYFGTLKCGGLNGSGDIANSNVLRSINTSHNINYSSSIGCSNDASALNYVTTASCSEPTPADFNLGTGWGQKQIQSVVTVSFEVGNQVLTSLIYYASKEELIKMGVDMGTKVAVRSVMPSAFGEQKYCPVPKGWNG